MDFTAFNVPWFGLGDWQAQSAMVSTPVCPHDDNVGMYFITLYCIVWTIATQMSEFQPRTGCTYRLVEKGGKWKPCLEQNIQGSRNVGQLRILLITLLLTFEQLHTEAKHI